MAEFVKKRVTDHNFPPPFLWAETNNENGIYVWIECKMNNDQSNRNKQLFNEQLIIRNELDVVFPEEILTSIDFAIVGNKPNILMGDYNRDYLVQKQRKFPDTITIPYNLSIGNTLTTPKFDKKK